jgi:hypothetical protein
MTLNVVVEWLTLLLHIREVPGSYLYPEAGYLVRVFSWFSSVCGGKSRIVPRIRQRPLPFTYFPIHNSPIILSFDAIYSDLPRKRC